MKTRISWLLFLFAITVFIIGCNKTKSSQKPVKQIDKIKIKQIDKTKIKPKNTQKKTEPVKTNTNQTYAFPTKGRLDKALVRVYVLSDFQCPVCKRAATEIKPIIPEITKQEVAIIFVNYPLKMHRKAMGAAMATEAAFLQGKFWEFHDKLFENQQLLGSDFYKQTATELKLDVAKFEKSLKDPAIKAKIDKSRAVIKGLGGRGTPSFLINGKLQVGWGSASGLKGSIMRELKQAKALFAQNKSVIKTYQERLKTNLKTSLKDQTFFNKAFEFFK